MENNLRNSTIQETDITIKQRDEFVNFLDSEINNLRSEIQRPGWTTWAIVGSIAALVWLLLSEIQVGEYSLREVTGLFFIIWLFYFFCVFITLLINPASSAQKSRDRFIPRYLMSTGRMSTIALAGLQIFFIFVAINFSPDVGNLATIVAYCFISVLILASVSSLIVRFINIPIRIDNAGSTPTKILFALLAMLSSIPLWFYVEFLLISPGTADIFDMRFAILIAAISYLVLRLMHTSAGSLTLDSLIAIKREFFLRRMSLDIATRQVDIALTGLDASELFEEYVSKLLSLLRDAGAEYDECVTNLNELERLYPEMKNSRTEEQSEEFTSALGSIEKSIGKVETIVKTSYPKAFKPLQRRIHIASAAIRNADIFKDVLLKISREVDYLGQRQKTFGNRLKLFRATIEKDDETAQSG